MKNYIFYDLYKISLSQIFLMKNILIASDKFKFTLSANDVVSIISKEFLQYKNFKTLNLPLADGGEGTSEILSKNFNAKQIKLSVKNPLYKDIETYYFFSEEKKIALIDLASASGLFLLNKNEQNPMYTNTFGTGQMIIDAINTGAKKIIIAMGGSATNDLGLGAFKALGYRFLDKSGVEVKPIGKNLIYVSEIDDANVVSSLKGLEFSALYDVKNTLYGKNGAANVFAKQKGASKQELKILDDGLKNISSIIKLKYKKDISQIIGGGSAGGFGAGVFAFLDAKLMLGSEFVFNTLNIDCYVQKCDFIITGEGKFDKQSMQGKVVGELIKKANFYKKPIAVLCGVSELKKHDLKYEYLYSIEPLFTKNINIEYAKKTTKMKLRFKVKDIISYISNHCCPIKK